MGSVGSTHPFHTIVVVTPCLHCVICRNVTTHTLNCQVEDDKQKILGSFLLGMGLNADSEPRLPFVNLR